MTPSPRLARWIPLAALVLSLIVGASYGFAMGEYSVHRAKALVGALAFACSVAAARRARRGDAYHPAVVRGVAGGLAVLAIAAFYNFGNLQYWGLLHRRDVFHYYLGAKYHRELGYTRLYECVAVAGIDDGRGDEVRATRYRDLRSNDTQDGARAFAQVDACHARFSAARWREFRHDVGWFRAQCDLDYWRGIQTDHGYNPPPVWTLVGGSLASLAPASRGFMLALASLDLVLYALGFGALGWAFGARVMCAALVFYGLQEPAHFVWLSGTFLRQDWFCLLLLSVSLARRRRFALSGAALAWSAMIRLFPGVLGLGALVVIASTTARRGGLSRDHRRFLAGGVVTVAALFALTAAAQGVGDYAAHVEHLRHHDVAAASNKIGARTLLEFSLDNRVQVSFERGAADPFMAWEHRVIARAEATRPLRLALALLVLALTAWALRRARSLWVGVALSCGAVFAALSLNCYYYAFLTVMAPLGALHGRYERWLLGMVALSQALLVMPAVSYYVDDRFVALSLWAAALTLGPLLRLAWPRGLTRSPTPP